MNTKVFKVWVIIHEDTGYLRRGSLHCLNGFVDGWIVTNRTACNGHVKFLCCLEETRLLDVGELVVDEFVDERIPRISINMIDKKHLQSAIFPVGGGLRYSDVIVFIGFL